MQPHKDTLRYVIPNDKQRDALARLREKGEALVAQIIEDVPDGEDRNHAIRQIRDGMMWANGAIVRYDDGGARKGALVAG